MTTPRSTFIVFICCLIEGCMTFEATIKDAQPLALPAAIDPIPATVGVYYSSAFLMYEYNENLMGQHTMHFDMGEPSADHFDEVFIALFNDVRILDNIGPNENEAVSLDGIIEPIFEQMTVDDPALNLPGEEYVVTLAFTFRLLSPDGQALASWNIRGIGKSELHWGDSSWGSAGDAAKLAIEDVSRQLLTGFRAVPGVDQWINSLERQ